MKLGKSLNHLAIRSNIVYIVLKIGMARNSLILTSRHCARREAAQYWDAHDDKCVIKTHIKSVVTVNNAE